MSDEKLERYASMRRFDRTTEPRGGKTSGGAPRFVVQKHAATRLHYDVRFEVDGVMPSWAVPKGPSYDPVQKRLAVHTEDHPLDYQYFEGDIPRGEYGGGSVIVWDAGTYENISKKNGRAMTMSAAIAAGHFSVRFDGQKLQGGWSFTRTSAKGDKEQWIMVKRKDELAQPGFDITLQAHSVLSDARLDEDGNGAGDDEAATDEWQPPMLAKLADRATGSDWIVEPKLDGLRCIAVRRGKEVHLWSRNHLSYDAKFPKVRAALAALPLDDFVLDGELATFDGSRTSFAALRGGADGGNDPMFCIFDVLRLLGRDVTGLPIEERKALLAKAIEPTGPLMLVEALDGTVESLLRHACVEGWEGIVAKRAGSAYTEGRSGQWLKLKCSASQELVIGGWTEPQGARNGFGALLVGYYDGNGFRYAGKVGTGFSAGLLGSLHGQLAALERQSSPFDDQVKEKRAHWCTPKLVAEVAFTEWTTDGKLRHPSFKGLRPDKVASEVRRER